MEDEDCEMNFMALNLTMEIFHNSYKEYIIFDGDTTYWIKDLEIMQENLDKLIDNLNRKFKESKKSAELLQNTKLLNDIKTLNNSFERCLNRINQQKLLNDKKIEIIKKEELTTDKNNLGNIDLKNNQVIVNNNNKKNSISDIETNYSEDQNASPMLQLEIQEDYMNRIYDEDFKIRIYNDNFKVKELKDISSKLYKMQDNIKQDLILSSHAIHELSSNVEETNNNIEKTNEELRQAALYKNKANKIKLPLYYGTAFCAVGTIIPVVGNIVGAAIGSSIGAAIAKVEEIAIKKIEPEKYKK